MSPKFPLPPASTYKEALTEAFEERLSPQLKRPRMKMPEPKRKICKGHDQLEEPELLTSTY